MKERFDVVIIDEASQALEAQCWVPLLRASKVVLAGDHLQLPPTIKSLNSKTKKARTKDDEGIIKGMSLEITLFDRLLKLHGPGIKRMLTMQYRMHEKIMRFPSDELYESKLVAADGVKARLLQYLPYEVKETEDTTEVSPAPSSRSIAHMLTVSFRSLASDILRYTGRRFSRKERRRRSRQESWQGNDGRQQEQRDGSRSREVPCEKSRRCGCEA